MINFANCGDFDPDEKFKVYHPLISTDPGAEAFAKKNFYQSLRTFYSINREGGCDQHISLISNNRFSVYSEEFIKNLVKKTGGLMFHATVFLKFVRKTHAGYLMAESPDLYGDGAVCTDDECNLHELLTSYFDPNAPEEIGYWNKKRNKKQFNSMALNMRDVFLMRQMFEPDGLTNIVFVTGLRISIKPYGRYRYTPTFKLLENEETDNDSDVTSL